MSVSVVAPTYREADNIRILATRIRDAMEAAQVDWELILADDDSRDGSEEVALELGRSLPVRFHVRRARPRDLSQSVLEGIRVARFDRLVVMDADLSHPPDEIPELLAALGGDAEMALGSRYAPGGRIDGAWGRYRTLNSRVATWLTRPLTGCADPMSGFFAVDRRRLPSLDELAPVGFKIALELVVRGELRVREVPIRFNERHGGSSKLTWRQQLAFLRHLFRLYRYRFGLPVRLLSFGAVGATGLIVDTAFYLGLQAVGPGHLLARFLSFWPAVTWNWRLNRVLTFDDRRPAPAVGQWTRFAFASTVGLATNVGSYAALTSFVEPFTAQPLLALFAGVAIGSAANFAVATRFVYRRSRPAPDHE
ncbi:MAG: glycosyltransferase family 2 protein [Holophagales bacterium]|nr:glycosyltransferase family 2 protein [Holophagales bacterium]MYC11972.1 glycosyltransferase family 2 protein [Holophagales bacterium]